MCSDAISDRRSTGHEIMPKIKANKIMDSGGVIAAGESHISNAHWKKIIGKGKETDIIEKLKITKDTRKKVTK